MKVFQSMAEHKYHDKADLLTPNYSGIITDISAIAQGQTDTTRVGDKVILLSLQFKGVVTVPNPDIGTEIQQIIRVIYFIYKDDTTPVVGTIMESTGDPNAINSPFIHDRQVKRKVLYDKCFTVKSLGTIAGGYTALSKPIAVSAYIPLTKLKNKLNTIHYEGGGTTGVNKIWMLVISDSALSTGACSWRVYNRLNYIDA